MNQQTTDWKPRVFSVKWSRKHDCCTSCGTTEIRHNGHGLCRRCSREEPRIYKTGRWSTKHDHCVSCGGTDSPHIARGLCRRCYGSRWYQKNRKRVKAHYREDRKRLKAQSAAYYWENRERVLARDRGKRRATAAGRRYFVWSKEYPYCQQCRTTVAPHAGHGLCCRCIQRWRRASKRVLPRSGTCAYCGEYSMKLTVDHVIPLAAGGTDDTGNLVGACPGCNSSKRHSQMLSWVLSKQLHGTALSQLELVI
ncbi:MAG TPA: HNH endonuclease signature motif containing protein [Anaerolineae bacterium]|nr:HNH endonuclease signature motif containing protein [Anaerolineae bacterium]